MEKEYDFIINPKARSGMGMKAWQKIESELKARHINYRVYLTKRRGHAAKTAAFITADDKRHTIVDLGGYVTVNEVVNGKKRPDLITFGYIPIGSSNDFARGLKLPKDPMKALQSVLSPKKVISADVGQISREGKSRRFIVSAGMGFDAGVCHEVCVSQWKKRLNKIGLGKLSYAVVALDRLKKDRPTKLTVTLPDGRKQMFEKTLFVAFMNLPYEGGGFRFAPEASVTDGCIDIVIAHHMSPLKAVWLLPRAFFGKHTGAKEITIIRSPSVSVEAQRSLPIHTDGEAAFSRYKASVEILEEKLHIIAG